METQVAQRTFVIRARSAELNDRAFDSELLPQFFHLFHRQSLSSLDRVAFDLRSISWGNPYGALGVVLVAEVQDDPQLVERYRFLPITALPKDRAEQMKLLKDVAVGTHEVLVRDFH